MRNRRGVALAVVLIFVIVLSIMAGTAVVLMANHSRVCEYQIRRAKAFYTAEAAIVKALEDLRTTGGLLSTTTSLNTFTATVSVEAAGSGTGPNGTRILNATVEY